VAKGTASELLIRRAQRELQSCRAYLAKHFAAPSEAAQKQARKRAIQCMKRLGSAIGNRDAAAIANESAKLSKVVVYLWALKQFRDEGH
jgi:hypothetical protein